MDKPPSDPVAYAFVQDVMRQLGVTKARELAQLLGWAETDNEVKVGRWVSGRGAPNFHGTMALLRAAGRLKESGAPEAAEAAAVSSGPVPGSAEDLLERVTRSVDQGFAKLERRIARLEKQRAAPGQPAQPKRKTAG